MRSRVLIATIGSALVGAAHSTGIPALMCLAVLFPLICAVQLTRLTSAFCAAIYYLAAGWPIVAVTRNYLGPEEGTPIGLLMWFGAALILTTPWLWAWSPKRRNCAAKMCAAIVIGIIPPLGIIGVASPVMASGFVFPGLGWLGLILTTALPAAVLLFPLRVITCTALLVIACNYVAQTNPPKPVPGWESVNTTFQIGDDSFHRLLWVRARAERSTAAVIVFPENVVPNWTAAPDLYWEETERLLVERNQVALIGVTVPAASHVRNALLIRGAETGAFDQRIPVPIGMWQPFGRRSVPLNPAGHGTIEIAGQRAAVLICYEQLIPWPWLHSMAERPSIIVAIANDFWGRWTSLATYRAAACRSWTRLFRAPLVSASNDSS